MGKKMTRKNSDKVLTRLAAFIKANKPEGQQVVDRLNDMLDEAAGDDLFGTEAQLDPRGDRREEG